MRFTIWRARLSPHPEKSTDGQAPHAVDLHLAAGRGAGVLPGVRGEGRRRDDGDLGRGRGHRVRAPGRPAARRLRRGPGVVGPDLRRRRPGLVPARADRHDRDRRPRDAKRRREHSRGRRQRAGERARHERVHAHAVRMADGVPSRLRRAADGRDGEEGARCTNGDRRSAIRERRPRRIRCDGGAFHRAIAGSLSNYRYPSRRPSAPRSSASADPRRPARSGRPCRRCRSRCRAACRCRSSSRA